MANGLFIGAARDLPGAISRGLEERDVRESRGLSLARQQAGQAGLIQQDQLGLESAQRGAERESLIGGAEQLSVLSDRNIQLDNLKRRNAEILDRGGNPEHTQEGIQLLEQGMRTGDFSAFDQSIQDILSLRPETQRGASSRAFAPKTVRKQVGEDEKGNPVFGLFESQIVFDPSTNKSTLNEIPLEGDLVTSTGETITTKRLEEIKSTQAKSEAKALGTAKGEAKSAPLIAETKSKIASAVKIAVAKADARGESLTDLNRSRAALPGLRSVIGQLKELAPIATSTLGGRGFDFAVREAGFGSTKGADARAKFIALVNNQVLPLLKPTFGAAFTVPEGDSLRATMGDPNLSPSEKFEQLSTFIEAKAREIQTKERELGQDVTPTEALVTGQPAQQDTGITAEQFRTMTAEQRAAFIQQARGQ